jgi:predicted RNase H-like HicB family nuclease
MHLPVLIEPLPDGAGFIAKLGDPFNLSTTAETAAEAFVSLQAAFKRRLEEGAQVVALLAPAPSVFPPSSGWLPDDDLTREWLGHVEAYREECDAAERRRILGEPPDAKEAS